MAQDENGIDPKAKDGAPDEQTAELELARRRLAREQRERKEEDATGMSERNGRRGTPIDDQPEAEPSEGELFPVGSIPGDHKVTMKNIVPPGKTRKTEAAMSRAAVPLLDGLVRYGDHVELLVTAEAGAINEVPDLEDSESSDRRVLRGVKDVQSFRVVHVRSAAAMLTVDQVLDILQREFGIPRSADKVREVFGLDAPQAVAAG